MRKAVDKMKRHQRGKKLVSMLLVLCMAMSMLTPAFAANSTAENIIASGECGISDGSMTWTLDEAGVLYIEGTGEMDDFVVRYWGTSFACSAPWWEYRQSIYEVVFLPGVTSVGEYAFYGCNRLKKATFGDTIIDIGRSAFETTAIKEFILPDGLQVIGSSAFYSGNYTTVSIPASVREIGGWAFNSNSLVEINVDEGNKYYKSIDGILYSVDQSTLIKYPPKREGVTFSIPTAVNTLASGAFYNSRLSHIDIPNSVTEIGSNAFENSNLEYVVIPESVSEIPRGAFIYCGNIEYIVLPDTIKSIGYGAIANCSKLTDIYYGASETQWAEISFGDYNGGIDSATIHYNSTGPEEPSERQSGSVRYFSKWDADTQTAYWGGLSLTGTNKSVVVEGTTDLSFLDQLDQLVGSYVQVEDQPGENGVLSDRILLSIKPVDSQFGVVEDIIVGNGNPAVVSLQFGGHTYAVVDGVDISDALIGKPLLYHLRMEEVVGYELLDEKIGTLKSWDSANREIVIDDDESGKVTTTVSKLACQETITALNENTIQNPEITYLADAVGFVYQVTITGDETPNVPETAFDVNIYRANHFLYPDEYLYAYTLMDDINRETPSGIYADAFAASDPFQRAVKSWKGTTTAIDLMEGGASETYDLIVEKKDIYAALILAALEEATQTASTEIVYEQIQSIHDSVKKVAADVKNEVGVDLFVAEQYISLHDGQRNQIVDIMNRETPITSCLSKFKNGLTFLSDIMKVSGSIDDFTTLLSNNLYFVTMAEAQKDLIAEMYERCPSDNTALKAALWECKQLTESNYNDVVAGTLGIATAETVISTYADIFWENVTAAAKKSFPILEAISVGYKAGKTASNILCGTDSIVENYYKIVAMTELEAVAISTLDSLEAQYASGRTSENASLYLGMIDTLYGMLIVDCKQASNMVDALDDAGINLLAKALSDILGNEGSAANKYETIKKQIESIKLSYKTGHKTILTVWVEYLPDDYPNSNLYEQYSELVSKDPYAIQKQLVVACPVDVKILDSYGNAVASVIDGRLSAPGNVTVQLVGDQKIFGFYDTEPYQVEITGYDIGTMDVLVTEYNDQQEEIRHIYYTAIPVETDTSYIMDLASEKTEYQLMDVAAGTTIKQTLDTAYPEEAETYTVQIENGYLNLNGTISASAQAYPGQEVQVSALALSDQRLIRWNVSGNTSLKDPTALSTSFIMPNSNVVLSAVLSETELQPESPDNPDHNHGSGSGSTSSGGGTGSSSSSSTDKNEEELDDTDIPSTDAHLLDVPSGAWYKTAVNYVYEKGIMSGTGAGMFSPDLTTTRAMIVTILYRLEGTPIVSGVSDFTDVESGQWYSNAIDWATANAIVSGYGNGLFGLDDYITREQLAAILYRYAQYKDYDISASSDLSRYTDLDQLSMWAQDAMAWANAEGIVNGTSATTLSPQDNATRAQAAAMLMQFCENVVI